jgi:hypothetical protein
MLHQYFLCITVLYHPFVEPALCAGLVGLDISYPNITTRFCAKIALTISVYIDSKFAATRLG